MNLKKEILTLASIISIGYCLQLGYLLTAYAHGGQLLGVPFATWILFFTIKYYQTAAVKYFAISLTSFISFFLLAIVIQAVKAVNGNWFEFLYVYGNVDTILFWWLIVTLLIILSITRYYKRKQISDISAGIST